MTPSRYATTVPSVAVRRLLRLTDVRILVCDDEPDAGETLRVLLASEGHEVVSLRDGKACLAKAIEWQPEIAFLDVGMPGMTGYAVARHMRAHFGRRIVLVAVTAYGTREDRTVAFEAGFDVHLTKPVSPARLLSIAARPASARTRG